MSSPSRTSGSDTLQTLIRNLSAHENRPVILVFHNHSVDTRSFTELSDEIGRLASSPNNSKQSTAKSAKPMRSSSLKN